MSQEQLERGSQFSSGLIGRRGTTSVETRERPKIDDIFKEADEIAAAVRCVNGANERNMPIMGRTVEWARTNLQHDLNIAPGAAALIDGEKVGEDTVLKEGQTLEFLKESGRKG